ncbi:MAG: GNAT family N-acetyltransferase [Ferrovibrio sp.]|uniref:GNAT family N-acetyltransferase n=1 Tax=Ferrovibrio sp. TaxID=1917215 RepID=UPI00391DD54D
MAVLIRNAVASDISAVSALLIETWHDTYDALLGRDKVDEITRLWHAPAVLQQQLQQRGTCFLVAESDREIMGHAFAQAWNLPILNIARLYVRPDWQRQGIGNRFLDRLIALHPAADKLCLSVEKGNIKAVAFYLRQGFSIVDETTEDGSEILLMEKPLPQQAV